MFTDYKKYALEGNTNYLAKHEEFILNYNSNFSFIPENDQEA
jgi:hypothetical protein